MNEKTKTILSHIGCALGGMALSIALLGGLSYCSMSEKTEQTEVNTILTKKNAQINTGSTGGNYIGYKFEVPSVFPETTGDCITYVYFVTGAYDLVSYTNTTKSGLTSYEDYTTTLRTQLNIYRPTGTNALRFMASYARVPMDGEAVYLSYYSFLPSTGPSETIVPRSFILTSSWTNTLTAINMQTDEYYYLDASFSTPNFYINLSASDYLLKWNGATSAPIEKVIFQDVISYYKSIGYGDGYTEGEATGYNQGLSEGLEYGQEFTTYQVMTQDNNGGTYWPSYGWTINNNAPSGMYGGFSSSTYQIANLMQYKTQDDDLHLIYLMLPIEQSGDLFGHVYIYVYNLTDSVLEDTGLAYGIRYYQTTADEKGWDYAYMFWTSGGTRTLDYGKVTAIYNDSLQKGYIQLSGLVYQETIYNTGYQAGLLAGQTSSNMNNVFSLFTTAFNAVGGFFELQVFGFLPLYWFFLAPLFVALIALILRMVKH